MKEIAVDEKTCLNVKEAMQLEWLDTNGLGGYASSSVIQCHTRKYHGFLAAVCPEAAGRFVLLSKVEDSLFSGDTEIPLACKHSQAQRPGEWPLCLRDTRHPLPSRPCEQGGIGSGPVGIAVDDNF